MRIKNHLITLKNQGIHLAAVNAGPAARTLFGIVLSSEWAGHELGWSRMRLDPGQNRTTAATAAAHDNQFLRVVRLENEVGLVGHGEDL